MGRRTDGSRGTRRVLAAVAGTWTARGYLALCCALLLWALADAAFVEHQDASFAGVVPLLATAPLSVAFILLLPEGSAPAFVLAVLVSALVNAALITWCVRVARRHRGRSGAAS